MIKAVLFCAVFAVCAVALRGPYSGRDLESELEEYSFKEFLIDFEKSYSDPAEYARREEIFHANLAQIKMQNSMPNRRWNAGVNRFADMTPAEMKRYRGHSLAMAMANRKLMADAPDFQVSTEALPASVDWRSSNVLSPVKDQGSCGSCWAHATTETIESAVAIASKMKAPILSRQQVTRCTKNPQTCGGTGQCEGATSELGFAYVASAGGITTEDAYPYTGTDGDCQDSKFKKVAAVSGFVKLPENNYTSLLAAVATVGPIAISVDASSWSFYSSGVYDGCSYSNIDIDHAVQLVGYGVDPSGTKYWIVRNSWSAGWGENGFIRLMRHDGSSQYCGIDYQPGDGTGCSGGPSQITVCGTCGILSDSSYPTGAKWL